MILNLAALCLCLAVSGGAFQWSRAPRRSFLPWLAIRAAVEVPTLWFFGIPLSGWAKSGAPTALRGPSRRNPALALALGLGAPAVLFLATSLTGSLTGARLDILGEALSGPIEWDGLQGALATAFREPWTAVFAVLMGLSLPLSALDPRGALGWLGLIAAVAGLGRFLSELGLGFSLFSKGWWALWLYGEGAEAWLRGFCALGGAQALLLAAVVSLFRRRARAEPRGRRRGRMGRGA